MKQIRIGYEVKTGEAIYVAPSHLVVSGLTQLSGKTTTLEALIQRSGCKAIVFKTKTGGERGFTSGTIIPPFFVEQSDWEYVKDLLEASMKEKLKFERSWIIEVTKNTDSLKEVAKNIDARLADPKLRSLDRSVFVCLQAYLQKILPQLEFAQLSNTLTLNEGINIMNLEQFAGDEVKSLVIRSVLNEILAHQKKVIVVIPEAWKFLPEGQGNPCKPAAEAFVRQGASNSNFLWIDSQDITGVSKVVLKQVSTWVMGYQSEVNEVIRTLDQLPIPKSQKPSADEIMSLKLGHFYVSTREFTKQVYVQPAWMDSAMAQKIAKGEVGVDSVSKPERLAQFAIQPKQSGPLAQAPQATKEEIAELRGMITEARHDFFEKTQNILSQLTPLQGAIYELRNEKQQVNVEEIVGLVLQKMPVPQSAPAASINEEALFQRLLMRIPRQVGTTVYEVAPLEKIRKDFLEEAKAKVLADVAKLDEEQKKILKYVEAQGSGQAVSPIVEKCLFKAVGGSNNQNALNKLKAMAAAELVRYDISHGKFHPNLKAVISKYCSQHGATEQEIQQVYDHILAGIDGKGEVKS